MGRLNEHKNIKKFQVMVVLQYNQILCKLLNIFKLFTKMLPSFSTNFSVSRTWTTIKLALDLTNIELSYFSPAMNNFPQELMRRYEVNFKCSSDIKPTPVRDVKANCIGKLVSIRGIVTRASEVGPIAVSLIHIKTSFSNS